MENFDRVNEELHELFGFGLDPTEFWTLTHHDQDYCLLIIKELIRDAKKGIMHKITIHDMLTGVPSITKSLNL
jgi:hypothetical protein